MDRGFLAPYPFHIEGLELDQVPNGRGTGQLILSLSRPKREENGKRRHLRQTVMPTLLRPRGRHPGTTPTSLSPDSPPVGRHQLSRSHPR